MSDILLIEPNYKSTYPPIGLMKIAYFHRYMQGDYVRFAKGKLPDALSKKKWDRVYVTTLFTFEWDITKEALEYALRVVKEGGQVYTGGILATLMPELIRDNFPEIINNTGLLNHKGTLGLPHDECIDTLPLDYGILEDVKDVCTYPAHDAYFTYMTRGCGMNCTFCAVKTLEPSYQPYVSITDDIHRIDREFGPKKDLLLMDNNVLRSPKFDQIIDEIIALGYGKGASFKNPKTGKTVQRYVDFNQGLDAFLMTPEKAKRLGELAIKPARIAFDHIEDKEAYARAITLCAENGVDYMSNYLLYNGEDFTGKGHTYHADTPEDLYERMKITMELSENLTARLGRKISIFSFPMRYIPLSNLSRGFIGKHWNAKYLRALQCMLIPTQGKGVSGRSFFEADFGKDEKEFVETLAMPERLISKRGFFVKRKGESEKEEKARYDIWNENQHLINTWRKLYRKIDATKFLEYIGCNRFDEVLINKISNENMKKLYFLYFTEAGMIRVLENADENTKKALLIFIKEELPILYSRIITYAATINITAKQLNVLVDVFGVESIKEIIKNRNLFDSKNVQFNNRLQATARSKNIGFNFSLLNYLPLFDSMGVFEPADKNEVINSVCTFDEKKLREKLLGKLDELKDIFIMKAADQPGNEMILREIEESIKGVYEQLSLF
ncbi:hypothetical protein SAMN06296386_1155 [Lachnospiraceae bacterium]|nr:hypothetical protein SAMN06296386_1155 [Lachnospiraceae bacterium]